MKTPGYCLTIDDVAEMTGARREPSSPTGWSFLVKNLFERYEHCGLHIETVGTPGTGEWKVDWVACGICGSLIMDYGDKLLVCDPEKHRAYYDAFE